MPTDPTTLATTLAADLVTLHAAGKIASPWLAGMTDAEAGAVCVKSQAGSVVWAVDDWLSDWCELEGTERPDLSKPLTAQALLLLVREASRKPHITVMVSTDEEGDPDFTVWSVRVPARYGTHSMASGPTEAAALCTALHTLAEEVRRG